jgi:hypothetical protein
VPVGFQSFREKDQLVAPHKVKGEAWPHLWVPRPPPVFFPFPLIGDNDEEEATVAVDNLPPPALALWGGSSLSRLVDDFLAGVDCPGLLMT